MKTRSLFLFIAFDIYSECLTCTVRSLRAINRQIDHKIDSLIDKSAQDERDKKAREESEQ